MANITEQVQYWNHSAKEDFEVAEQLIENSRIRHGLFFIHLSLEKMLKAIVCQKTQEIAPRIHNLIRLVEMACLPIDTSSLDFLSEMNEFNIEGRYPIQYLQTISKDEAQTYLLKGKEMLQWLARQLPTP